MTIKQRIIEKLERDGQIDNFFCIDTRLTTRLGAFIFTLKEEGWKFDEERSGYLGDSKNWIYYVKEKPKKTLFS